MKKIMVADASNIWFEYDNQNDILYINFGTDIEDADDQILTENNVVVRIKKGKIVSLTVFDLSKKIGRMIY